MNALFKPWIGLGKAMILFILLVCFFRGLFTQVYELSGVCIVGLFFYWYIWGF